MNFIGDCDKCENLRSLIFKMGQLNFLSDRSQDVIEELLRQADHHVQERHDTKVGRKDLIEELERLSMEYGEYQQFPAKPQDPHKLCLNKRTHVLQHGSSKSGGLEVDRKELRLGDDLRTLGRVPVWEVTVSDSGKVIGRQVVCEMNAFHPDWRDYVGRIIGALNARGTQIPSIIAGRGTAV